MNWVFYRPVGHAIEALKMAKGYALANNDIEVYLLLNSDTPIELANTCAWIKKTYAISLKEVFEDGKEASCLKKIPKNWDYISTTDRARLLVKGRDWDELVKTQEILDTILTAKIAKGYVVYNGMHGDSILPIVANPKVTLNIPYNASVFAKKFSHRGATIAVMLGGSAGLKQSPSVEMWLKICQSLYKSIPKLKIYFTGVSKSIDGRTSTAGFTLEDVNFLISKLPNAESVYDVGLWNQIAFIKQCDVFLSPHTGFGFIPPLVGTKWLEIGTCPWPAYFLNDLPFYSVLPNCGSYPSGRNKENGCGKLLAEGKQSLCVSDDLLKKKIPEIVKGANLLLDKEFTYEKALQLHLRNKKKDDDPKMIMKHIVFKIFPAFSHFNATYKFANQLKTEGYKITYAGGKRFEKEVLSKGFQYFIDEEIFRIISPTFKQQTIFQKLFKYSFKHLHIRYLEGDAFDNILTSLTPDLIVVDSPYVRQSIPLYNRKVPFVIFESMVALNKRPYSPPLNSKIIPKFNFYCKVLTEVAWQKYFLLSFLERIFFGSFFPSKAFIIKLAKKTQFPVEQLDFNRYFHIGLKNIPELFVSPLSFDFPHKKLHNQIYIGPPTNFERQESSYDYKYKQTKKEIAEIQAYNSKCIDSERIMLVYCSFGTMPWRYKGVKEFYAKLLNIFRNRSNYRLFISIGYEFNYHFFRDAPPHITVFQKVPQIDILKEVDLMITHGGMNTITECILLKIPMLVYPGTSLIDQVGNASRVEFHKIGLTGNLRKDSEKDIMGKVTEILTNPIYKQRISTMSEEILANDGTEGVTLIKSLLNPSL